MATIKDVARLAGVGVGTASRVVSGNGSVAPETAQRVRQAIADLNFRPSHAARTLLSGSSQMIGVYIPVLKGTFYTPLLSAIDHELRLSGRHMVVAFGSGDGNTHEQAMKGIEFLIERGCDGVVVMSNAMNEDDLLSLGPKREALVFLNHHVDAIDEQCFTIDHERGGILAAQALLKNGHRKFAVIGGPQDTVDNLARLKGFHEELARAGIGGTDVLALSSDFSPEGGWASARSLISSGHSFTALFCANDEMAIGALAFCHQAGIGVPANISVLGYDDIQSAEFSAPQLTTVHIPWRQLTLSGLRWLLNRCYREQLPVVRHLLPSITWRASVGPAPDGTA